MNLTTTDKSLLTIKVINKTQEDDIYKYDIQLVYDGVMLEQNDYKGISQIKIEQEGDEKYQSTALTFQIKFEQEYTSVARILPYDETMGSVESSCPGAFPFGYWLDQNNKSITFTFYSKKGYRLKEVKVNGVSLGRIGSYVVKVGKNYLIEPIWEEYNPAIHLVKVTYSAGGSVKVNNQSVTSSGQSVTVAASTDVKVAITPQTGYHIKQVQLGNEDVTSQLNNNLLVFSSISANKEITVTFEKDALVTHTVKVTYSTGGSVKVDDQSVTSGQSAIVTASTDVKVAITPQAGYHIKQVQLGNEDVTGQLSNNVLNISSISANKDITVIFEKDTPITYSVKVTYSAGGSVKVNGQSVTSGQSFTASTSTDVKVTITPQTGYHIKQVQLGNEDVTGQLSSNVLTISSISANKNITVIFEKDTPITHSVKVSYSTGGSVMVNGQSVTSGQSATASTSTDVKVTITPQAGYHIKQVQLGNEDVTGQLSSNVLTISSISANKEITVTFEKDALVTHSVKVNYSTGGNVKVNGQSITSGQSVTASASTDVKVTITVQAGYHIKQVLLGNEDVTSQLSNNVLTILSISADKDVTVTFEKEALVTYVVEVTYSEGGSVQVNDQLVTSGNPGSVTASTDVKVAIIPNAGYRIRQVKLGSEDITNQVSDNVLTISSISANVALSIIFEQIPTYKLTIDMTGGTGCIRIGDKEIMQSTSVSDITEGTMLDLNFLSDKYYEVKRAILGRTDITAQIKDGYYEIESMESDLALSVEYQRKSYVLTLGTFQGVEKVCVNQQDYKDVTQINLPSGETMVSIYSNELYYIKQVFLNGKVIYEDTNAASDHTGNIKIDIDGDKELTVFLTLREKRKLSVEVAEPGTLKKLLSDEDIKLVTHLVIGGKIDQRDFVIMNQMKSLLELDLRNAAVVEYDINSVNTIPDKAFYNNQTLQSMYLPQSIEAIGKLAFSGSVISTFNLNDLSVKTEYLTKIGEDAFKDCNCLVIAPDLSHVTIIERGVFENCSNLAGVSCLPVVIEVKDAAFKNCVKATIQFNAKSSTCLEKVGDYAFENVECVYFDSTDKLYYIGNYALRGCLNTSFYFGDCLNLTELPSFENCSKMQSIIFPPNVKRVCSNSFIGCNSLQTVHMADCVEEIEEYAFKDSPLINYVYLPTGEIPLVSENCFNSSVYQSARLFVPANKLQFYKEHAIWGNFENIRTYGIATNYMIEILLSKGGTVGVRQNEGGWDYCYYAYLKGTESSRIEFHVRPEQDYLIESILLNGKDIKEMLDENNQFVVPHLQENLYLSVKFKKEEDPTANENIESYKRVYRSASKRLSLSGFAVGVPVYIYDAGGRLVVMKAVRESVEDVDLPADGLYFVRVGNESFKIIL